MASRKQIQSITGMWAVLSTAAGLLFVGSRVASAESPEPKGPSPVIATATPAKVPPVPVAGPLAGPRSLKQVGLPIQQTLAEIPADNPQTPEKIALGEKLFSNRAYLQTEPWPVLPATIRSAHSPTAGPHQWGFRGG